MSETVSAAYKLYLNGLDRLGNMRKHHIPHEWWLEWMDAFWDQLTPTEKTLSMSESWRATDNLTEEIPL